jgi:CoA:oxalate CoA-transferase
VPYYYVVQYEAFHALDMIQDVTCRDGSILRTTRCPIRIAGETYKSSTGAPGVGQHTDSIMEEFDLSARRNGIKLKR